MSDSHITLAILRMLFYDFLFITCLYRAPLLPFEEIRRLPSIVLLTLAKANSLSPDLVILCSSGSPSWIALTIFTSAMETYLCNHRETERGDR